MRSLKEEKTLKESKEKREGDKFNMKGDAMKPNLRQKREGVFSAESKSVLGLKDEIPFGIFIIAKEKNGMKNGWPEVSA